MSKMTINCRGTLIDLRTPRVMGILNATPDSFFQNSRVTQLEVVKKTEEMLLQGVDFVDVGGYSTRPGADEITPEEELQRLLPIVRVLVKEFPQLLISIDTFRSEVARCCLLEGACMINDISAGLLDDAMWEVIADFQVPYIAMHLKGTPHTMEQHTDYKDIVKEMLFYFSERKTKAQQYGINDFIIDPGFGFSKTLEQNYEVLQKMKLFQMLELPILVGFSRKSMLFKLLETSADQVLNATTVVNTLALTQGANILRVHDVKEAKECVKIFQKIQKYE